MVFSNFSERSDGDVIAVLHMNALEMKLDFLRSLKILGLVNILGFALAYQYIVFFFCRYDNFVISFKFDVPHFLVKLQPCNNG